MSTSPPASNDALLEGRLATKVFGIPELAEAILLNLPIKDLLFAQLICKDIKNLIDGSTRIQRALFLLPGKATSAHFESKHESAPFNWLHEGKDRGFPSEGGVNVNPLLCHYRYVKPSSDPNDWYEFKFSHRALDTICSVAERAERDSIHVVPSCAKMYLTQPPIATSVDLVVSSDEVEVNLILHAVISRGSPFGASLEGFRLQGKRPRRILMANLPSIGDDSRVREIGLSFRHVWMWFRKFCE
ncbi:hypothetical protein KC327_g7125 [Hortaea werneckii]|nr:hypothetical protein KC358_g7104 [Hortaea werneckii]KAI6834957.1 hypothetical protein KC350_g6622 [Hortaea werneckii]KAI6930295.1 hypothetical protein KC348_g7595 [Hortaea werneckii]KAI6935359.1 hypothetical protein KC341_g6982 [Hortaea werneckii]KAI6954277.1 hypothetical protein KC321_g16447 [Hortaea werneckii]